VAALACSLDVDQIGNREDFYSTAMTFMEVVMTRTDAVLDILGGPLMVGVAIVLLLGTRQIESWRPRKGYRQIPHHPAPNAVHQNGPVRNRNAVRFVSLPN
jgi:hypothetical protein